MPLIVSISPLLALSLKPGNQLVAGFDNPCRNRIELNGVELIRHEVFDVKVFVCEFKYCLINMGAIADLAHIVNIVVSEQSERTDFQRVKALGHKRIAAPRFQAEPIRLDS